MIKLLTATIELLTTNEQIEKMEQFCKENKFDANDKVQKSFKSAKFNLKWAEHNIPSIKKYLEKEENETPYSAPSSASVLLISYWIFLSAIFIAVFINVSS